MYKFVNFWCLLTVSFSLCSCVLQLLCVGVSEYQVESVWTGWTTMCIGWMGSLCGLRSLILMGQCSDGLFLFQLYFFKFSCVFVHFCLYSEGSYQFKVMKEMSLFFTLLTPLERNMMVTVTSPPPVCRSCRRPLIWTNLQKPRGLLVHPHKNLLIWTDWGEHCIGRIVLI